MSFSALSSVAAANGLSLSDPSRRPADNSPFGVWLLLSSVWCLAVTVRCLVSGSYFQVDQLVCLISNPRQRRAVRMLLLRRTEGVEISSSYPKHTHDLPLAPRRPLSVELPRGVVCDCGIDCHGVSNCALSVGWCVCVCVCVCGCVCGCVVWSIDSNWQ
jgi:hypothetical protein